MKSENTQGQVEQKRPRAQKFAKLVKSGRNKTVKYRAFKSSPQFKRLNRSLLKKSRSPAYLRKSIVAEPTLDRYNILQAPCTSERFYKKMEKENTIIFYVDPRATKTQIKRAFYESFNAKAERVNTLNCIVGGRKKAYIKVAKGTEASEIANKIGLI